MIKRNKKHVYNMPFWNKTGLIYAYINELANSFTPQKYYDKNK